LENFNPRRVIVGLLYNGKNIETSLAECLETFSYVDAANGEGDTIALQLENIDKRWLSSWFPVRGDQLIAQIKTYGWEGYKKNWNQDNGMQIFKCGNFMLDDFNFSGRPLVCTINGISTPTNSGFTATARSKNWKNISVKAVGEEIAKRAGVKFVYDAENIQIKALEQSTQTDAEFLSSLCESYGLYMKIYAEKIVVYDPAKYDQKEAVMTIDEKEMKSWEWKTTTEGTYTGGKMQYSNANKEEDVTCKVGSGNRILEVSGKADSKEDAKKKIIAAVNLKNREMTTMFNRHTEFGV